MLIWSGFGIVVPILAFGICFIVQMVFDSLFGHGFYTSHAIPKLFAGLAGGAALFFLGSWMNSDANISRILVDPNTGERVSVSNGSHTFFFIPVQYWGIIFAVFICVVAFL